MSYTFDASTSFELHSVATPGNDIYLHAPATRKHQETGEEETIDHGMSPTHECASYFAVKWAVDRVLTAMLMVVALPVMLLVGVAIALLEGRPVFYRQTRVGKNGRVFRIWKFRTMARNAESATGAVWSSESDPRVTALGRWLRCSHLDELPQFFNVLAGDMNLIGPRPERPEFVRELVAELPAYRNRLCVHPGITGLAQLHLGYDQSLSDVKRKVMVDAEYIRTASFLRDVKILFVTIPFMARQVIGKWTAGRRTHNSGDGLGLVVAPAPGPLPYKHRSEPSNTIESRPHFVLSPTTSSGFDTSVLGASASPLAFTGHGDARASEDRP